VAIAPVKLFKGRTMKKKQFETVIYSAGGIAALFIVLLAFNFIAARAKQRLDVTADKAFTLSQGTRAILAKLDTPVKIRFYATRGETMSKVGLQPYAQQIEDLLEEYREAAKGKITVEKLDPEPDSDAEDSARLDGVEGQPLPTGERIYLGLVVSQVENSQALPFLTPQRERLLEYDVTRAITRVANPEKPVLGIMSGMAVFGTPSNPMMARMGQQGQEPWAFLTELKRDFTVKQLELNSEKIDDDIKVLLLVHPKDLSDVTQYAIDQFIMRGGKVIAFVDPNPVFDQRRDQNPMMPMPGNPSTLEKLFKAWGLEFDTQKVVADMTFATQLQQGPSPAVLSVNSKGLNSDDPVTGQLDTLIMAFAGGFSGTPAEGLKQTVLVKTTSKSQLVDRFQAQMAGEQVANDFKGSGKEYALGIRLTGKFKTAFPDGKPGATPAEKPEDKKSDEKKTDAKPADGSLKVSPETSVILFSDADMLNDQLCLNTRAMQQMAMFGQKVIIMQGGNLPLLQNAVEQLSGDSNLITIRSRASRDRPFTVVKDMEARAQEEFRGQIKQLEEKQTDVEKRINELQAGKDKTQRFILSPEQQKELENFKKSQKETSQKLKTLRKDLKREIVSLENTLKWVNILAVPGLVILVGIFLAVYKAKRNAAQ
jgi:ABC-type uncharacterized transport system involved in gliding motility auxiliary subunit